MRRNEVVHDCNHRAGTCKLHRCAFKSVYNKSNHQSVTSYQTQRWNTPPGLISLFAIDWATELWEYSFGSRERESANLVFDLYSYSYKH